MLLNAASFIFVLGVLIFIHELGHFLVAKKVGIKVEKFSLGFPPHIFRKTVGDTTYCVGVVPLGGYVKMAGENPDEHVTGAPGEFMSKTVGQRMAVILAGPFMNYLLSILLLIGILFIGGRAIFDPERIAVQAINSGSPAERAGLLPADEIIAVDGIRVSRSDSLSALIHAYIEKPLNLTWVRGNDTLTEIITTMKGVVPRPDGSTSDTVGLIGVQLSQKIIGYERIGVWESMRDGFTTAHVIVWETVKFIHKYITGQVSSKMVGGPLFIAQQSGKEARKGAANLFFFMALLSVNLAVLNVLPIPVLDGGHLVFLTIEKLRGAPLSMKVRIAAQQVGMLVLLGLIVFVTYNDILRVIRGS
ncbi:MAG TPA: RIP metalloprotease RseP [Candidatus Deferrimicrobium sp.]|nr:RIP metalloprotease RseP [Candidatus Deferrimicrobium sp.]